MGLLYVILVKEVGNLNMDFSGYFKLFSQWHVIFKERIQ